MAAKFRNLFARSGDFFQRIQALLWGGSLIPVAAGFVAYYYEQIPRQIRELTLLLAIVILGTLSLAQIFYARHLWRQRKELLDGVEISTVLMDTQRLELLAWAQLDQSSRSVDEFLTNILGRKDLSNSEKRWRCIQYIVVACRDNVLPGIGPQGKRLSYLEYSDSTTQFTAIAWVPNQAHEFRNQLTRNSGLAGRAIQEPGCHYVEDIDSPKALEKGYVRGGPTIYKSIVCLGVRVNDVPVGVIAAQCIEKEAFTEVDCQMLERFGQKIELVYCAFPREAARGS